ncbi:MAG: hypothetical protein IKQ71_04620 [Lachnospiraceae bacterium]|nr:hypothetical protein [Lachnospiraceae bacterium]
MIRYLEADERGKIRELYDAEINVSKELSDYYFSDYLKNNTTRQLVYEENGEITAFISIHIKKWWVQGNMEERNAFGMTEEHGNWQELYHQADAWYLYAIADKDEGRSRIGELIKRVLSDAEDEKVEFLYLMPDDPRNYTPFGFSMLNGVCDWRFEVDELTRKEDYTIKKLSEIENKEEIFEAMARVYKEAQTGAQYDAFLEKTAEYYAGVFRRLLLKHGDIFLLYENNRLSGFAEGDFKMGGFRFTEVITIGHEDMIRSLRAFSSYENLSEIRLRQNAVMLYDGSNDAKWINRTGFLDKL